MKIHTPMMLAGLLTVLLSSCTTTSAPTVVNMSPQKGDLARLHKSYVDQGYATMGMAEYKKTLEVTGILLGRSKNQRGNDVINVSAVGSDRSIARLLAATPEENAKMMALPLKRRITAVCTVGFASGAGLSLPLTDCRFE